MLCSKVSFMKIAVPFKTAVLEFYQQIDDIRLKAV